MKWAYSITNKTTASILLFVVLGVVIVKNYLERNNARDLRDAIITIYDDRLVVESYIFQYSESLHEISAFALANLENGNDAISVLTSALAQINILNDKYLLTRLTEEEAETFKEFQTTCNTMEKNLQNRDFKAAHRNAEVALSKLKILSTIQLTEGKIEIDKATRSYSASRVLFTFEVAVIFIILIIIQGLIFASKTLKTKQANKSSLN